MKTSSYHWTVLVLAWCLTWSATEALAQNACCNILTNGDFEQGDTGFSSGLSQNCSCLASTYCVDANFQVKCAGWPNLADHTTGSGNFLIIDGNEAGPADVWRFTTPLNANQTYCLSFWVASVYSQAFQLGIAVNGNQVPGAVFSIQQATPGWTQYSYTWTGTSGTNVSIRQLTGGGFRDFGIDDIEFGPTIMANFTFQSNPGCGMEISFFGLPVGPAPLSFAWDFGDTGTSSQQNPTHSYLACAEYEVCFTVSSSSCSTTICKNVLVQDLVAPTVTCPPNLSVQGTINAMGNCTSPLPALNVVAVDDCDANVTLTNNAPAVLPAGQTVVTYTGTDDCGNVGSCQVKVTVFCEAATCACGGGTASGQNLVANGSFTAGNVGFTSGLQFPGCGCGSNSACVLPNFNSKCPQWNNYPDHTYGVANPLSQFLVIDGNETVTPSTDLYRTTVNLTPGASYCFSFWWATAYTNNNPGFQVEAYILDGTTEYSLGFLQVVQTTTTWTPTTSTDFPIWTNSFGLNGPKSLRIRQVTGGPFRDWGIDDICFKSVPCEAAFTFEHLDDCGKLQFNSISTGLPAGVTYCWDFDNNPATCESTAPDPMWQFPGCGTYTVCLTISGNGCSSTVCHTITVTDNVPPTALCQLPVGVILNANCTYTVTPAQIDGGTTDNCQLQSVTVSPTTISGCGITTITLTATDWCNNTSTCTTQLQTTEGIPPTIICPANRTVNALPPACSILVNGIGFLSATDNCGGVTVTHTVNNGPAGSSNASGTVFGSGVSTVVYQAEDQCDNTATCSFTVTVTCNPENCACPAGGVSGPNLIANGDFSSGAAGFTSGLFGPFTGCSTGRYGVIQNFSTFCSGWQNMGAASPPNFLVIDGSAASGPTVLWRSPVSLSSNTDYCFSFKWALGFANAQQNFPISIDIVDAGGAVIPNGNIGTQTIANNLGWTNASFNWNSGTLPTGISLYVVIRQLSGGAYRDFGIDDICFRAVDCEAAFTFQHIDNCGKIQFTSTSTNLPAGVTYCWDFDNNPATCESTAPNPMWQFSGCGTYTVCLTISGNGCSSTVCHTVTVTDNVPPTALCQLPVGVILNANCTYTVTPAQIDGGTTDNCQLQSVTVSPTTISGCGITTITLTATDWCNNTSTCTTQLQTTEGIPPTITCPPNRTVNAQPPACSIAVNGIGFLSATDNCGTPTVTHTVNNGPAGSSNASGTVFNQGVSTVVYQAEDQCDNTATCSFTVTVTCNPENCACPAGGASGPNLVTNGNFSSGLAGFTSDLFQANNCSVAGRYDVDQRFNLFCGSWSGLPDNTNDAARLYLILDGSDNGPNPTDLWKSNVTLSANTDYCFSFWWASAYANPDANFTIEAYIEMGNQPDIVIGSTQILQNSATAWTQAVYPTWNSGNLSGTQSVRIRQTTGDDHRDFGIDDICFSEIASQDSCCTDFDLFCQNIMNAVNVAVDPANCKVTLNVGDLPCDDYIDWVDWGDGTQSGGPFSGGSMPMHTYAGSGTYTISYLAIELDPATGLFCFEKILSDTITLKCPGMNDCPACPPNSISGPNLVQNGGFTVPGFFGTDYTPNFAAGSPAIIGGWSLLDALTVQSSNNQWNGTGHTGLPLDPFLALDGAGPGPNADGWRQTVAVQPGRDYIFCAFVNNLVKPPPTPDYADPVIEVWINGQLVAGPLNLPETPDQWVLMTAPWPSGLSTTAQIEIRTTTPNGVGNDWALDDLSLRECQTDTCHCGIFDYLAVRSPQGSMSQLVQCNDTATVICQPNVSVPVTGAFTCEGGGCGASSPLDWILYDPAFNQVASGSLTTTPYFSISLLPQYFQTSGVYTLTLIGHCGNQECLCIIALDVQACSNGCPCDIADIQALQTAVGAGFALVTSNSACKACFTPLALTDCESVEWHENTATGPLLGTSTGNQLFCFDFSASGSYTVVMVVKRVKPDGTPCETFYHSQTFNLLCVPTPICPDPVIDNPSFADSSAHGGLNSGGASEGWSGPLGDPKVFEPLLQGIDPWGIRLLGNQDASDVLSRFEPVCLEKTSGAVTLRFSVWWWDDDARKMISCPSKVDETLVVRLYRGTDFSLGTCDGANCFELAAIPLPSDTAVWFDVQIPYDLGDWPALDSCGSPTHGVEVRPAIFVTNGLTGSQGYDTRSSVILDQVCLDGLLVGVQTPEHRPTVRLFPNPNAGAFTLELSEPATPGMRIRIIGLTGQTVLEKQLDSGATQYDIQAGALPAGLYFLQMIAQGKVVAVEKLVKQ